MFGMVSFVLILVAFIAIFGYFEYQKNILLDAKQGYRIEAEIYLSKHANDKGAAEIKSRLEQIIKIEKEMKAVNTFTDCEHCPEMINLPAFDGIEKFALGQTEVTQQEWEGIMGSDRRTYKCKDDDCPKTTRPGEIEEFIKKLNIKTGHVYRLPTEKEWEYACLSLQKTTHCGGDNIYELGWTSKDSEGKVSKVKGKKPNGFGFYDMSGNVDEETSDNFSKDNIKHVSRGGSWRSGDINSVKERSESGKYESWQGFRIAMSRQ